MNACLRILIVILFNRLSFNFNFTLAISISFNLLPREMLLSKDSYSNFSNNIKRNF